MNLIKPKKKFGQNFLTDKNIAEKIVSYLAYKKAKTIIEVGPGKVGKRGIVSDSKDQQDACVSIQSFLLHEGWSVNSLKKSPILGSDGNLEFLI